MENVSDHRPFGNFIRGIISLALCFSVCCCEYILKIIPRKIFLFVIRSRRSVPMPGRAIMTRTSAYILATNTSQGINSHQRKKKSAQIFERQTQNQYLLAIFSINYSFFISDRRQVNKSSEVFHCKINIISLWQPELVYDGAIFVVY